MRYLWMAAGVAVAMVGLGFVFPQVAQWRTEANVHVALLVLGSAISLSGLGLVIYGLKLRRT
jgi:hypothetical protein